MTELEWKNKLHDALVNADDGTKIALYNAVYNWERIECYISALDYVRENYCDISSQLAELNSLYSSNVPYYGDYIIRDSGNGDCVGTLDELIGTYQTIVSYIMKDPFKYLDKIDDEDFSEVIEEFIDWKYQDDN